MARDCPTEAQEQKRLFEWADGPRAPIELAMMYHVPNGGTRNPREAHNLRLQGVKSGVPDICLPVPRGPFHGLYIELKRQRGGVVSDNQKAWITALNRVGYHAVICRGFDEARDVITKYLEL